YTMECTTIHLNVNGKYVKAENVDPETNLAYFLRYTAVNACLYPLYMAHHRLILTVEGIGSTKKLHPIQERIARGGFCAPGFVMSAYALLRNNPNPSIREINQAIKGNLCRCTGYRPIVEALQSFSEGGCCNGINGMGKCPCKQPTDLDREKLVTFNDFPKFDESQEILFPPEFI
ncbi:2Fe-2S iron-sulfur cluster-binding domain protein, partial [Ancylostoma duodenale]